MNWAEQTGLAAAALLAVVTFVEAKKGALTPRVGVVPLTLAMLAAVAALVHAVAW